MYHYANYREEDTERLVSVIKAYPLGLIVGCKNGNFSASHLPFMIERDDAGQWQLLAHMDRNNPQARELNGESAYIVFSGPNTYVSPTLYVTRQLPTWNYIAVHVSGRCAIETPGLQILDDIERLAVQSEASEQRWILDKTEERVKRLAPLICRLIVTVDGLEGRFKLSQEKGEADRCAVTEHLISQTPRVRHSLLERLCTRQAKTDDIE